MTLMLLGPSCTNIHIRDDTGQVKVERHWGFVSIEALPERNIQSIDIAGAGIARTPDGFVIGYFDSSIVAMPPTCGIAVWVRSEQDMAFVQRLVADHANICVANSNNAQADNTAARRREQNDHP